MVGEEGSSESAEVRRVLRDRSKTKKKKNFTRTGTLQPDRKTKDQRGGHFRNEKRKRSDLLGAKISERADQRSTGIVYQREGHSKKKGRTKGPVLF